MNNTIIDSIKNNYSLEEMDCGEFKKMKISPMHFNLESYKANSLFNVSYLSGKALFGFMKMTTIIITSNVIDIPLFSYDRMKIGKKDICIFEIYDTSINKKDYPELVKIKSKMLNYPIYKTETPTSDKINVKYSFAVVTKEKNKFDPIIDELYLEIIKIINNSVPCDKGKKREFNESFVSELISKGGPSTNLFKKKIGEEKTKELYYKYLFFIEE